MLRKLLHRLRASLRRRKVERELDAEVRFHLELEAAENVRRGMSEEEARRAALRSFGGVEKQKEAYRDLRRLRRLFLSPRLRPRWRRSRRAWRINIRVTTESWSLPWSGCASNCMATCA